MLRRLPGRFQVAPGVDDGRVRGDAAEDHPSDLAAGPGGGRVRMSDVPDLPRAPVTCEVNQRCPRSLPGCGRRAGPGGERTTAAGRRSGRATDVADHAVGKRFGCQAVVDNPYDPFLPVPVLPFTHAGRGVALKRCSESDSLSSRQGGVRLALARVRSNAGRLFTDILDTRRALPLQ